MMKMYKVIAVAMCFVFATSSNNAQEDLSIVKPMVEKFKEDPRGPYRDIRWFCPDGTILPPKESCPQPGGYQRARYKQDVIDLGERHHLFLGQILKGTEKEVFFDAVNNHSRMKQYILEQYLYSVDNGWIQEKSRFYRGAVQSEDEESWGLDFLIWMLSAPRFDMEHFFLYRESVKSIPHGEETDQILLIRSLSKQIADRNPSFMDLRTKIHGNPQSSDLQKVKTYRSERGDRLSAADQNMLDQLIEVMKVFYDTPLSEKMAPALRKIRSFPVLKGHLEGIAKAANDPTDKGPVIIHSTDLISNIKEAIRQNIRGDERLALIDISIALEQWILTHWHQWESNNLNTQIEQICYLGQLSGATGYIFDWEEGELMKTYTNIPGNEIAFEGILDLYRTVTRNISWGSAMINTEFGKEISRFVQFESLTGSFTDDRIRSSALLYLGEQASDLNNFLIEKANWSNSVFGKNTPSVHGINPGYAKGTLRVVESLDDKEVDPNSIYVFRYSPADLQPVAGILSVSEGNMVSHLQLLARNLGIPNANVSEELFNQLKDYEGREVFYAVSNRGGLVLKLADNMNESEKALFVEKRINEEVITVPTDQIQLDSAVVYSIADIDHTSSGFICGPKAANFAWLKKMFPEHLVNGLVIPFAIFKDHMLQQVPGESFSYWDFLSQTFEMIRSMKTEGRSSEDIEAMTFSRLAELRGMIKEMPLKKEFVSALESGFQREFDQPLGAIPVFLRSDTNMEDLKDFTGAGLNLTIFNTIAKEKILQGIKDVWASPYSERSYRWRQQYLTNPEDVYPSILVIPSVFVHHSGVIITKDFIEGEAGRINVAFSQGVGGAVDGQKAESWILSFRGRDILVSPARDRTYKYLTRDGGTAQGKALLSNRLLSDLNMIDMWRIIDQIYREMPNAGMLPPYDIELGFDDEKLWLFQIRPFVENRKANSSFYLTSLDPKVPKQLKISLDESLN